MVGVLVLFAARLFAPRWPAWPFWGAAALIGTIVYNIFIVVKPRLPLMLLAIVAAELGMLLSMPSAAVFGASLRDPGDLAGFISMLISAGVVGAFMAWALSVHRYPALVIAINFLLMFVLVGFIGSFLK